MSITEILPVLVNYIGSGVQDLVNLYSVCKHTRRAIYNKDTNAKLLNYITIQRIIVFNGCPKFKYSYLHHAITVCNLDLIKYYVSLGIKAYHLRLYNNKYVTLVGTSGNLAMIEYMVSLGLSIDDIRINNNHILKQLIMSGRLDIIKFIVPLYNKHTDAQKLLFDDIKSAHALRLSAQCGRLDMVKYFVWLSDPQYIVSDIQVALQYVRRNGSYGSYLDELEITKYLRDYIKK